MERTPIINHQGEDGEPGHRNWRVRFGKVQLLCPYCFKWFTLPKDEFKIDNDGNVQDVVYHFCDDDAHPGWCVLPQLVGWQS